jgi:hypothetical protein
VITIFDSSRRDEILEELKTRTKVHAVGLKKSDMGPDALIMDHVIDYKTAEGSEKGTYDDVLVSVNDLAFYLARYVIESLSTGLAVFADPDVDGPTYGAVKRMHDDYGIDAVRVHAMIDPNELKDLFVLPLAKKGANVTIANMAVKRFERYKNVIQEQFPDGRLGYKFTSASKYMKRPQE